MQTAWREQLFLLPLLTGEMWPNVPRYRFPQHGGMGRGRGSLGSGERNMGSSFGQSWKRLRGTLHGPAGCRPAGSIPKTSHNKE